MLSFVLTTVSAQAFSHVIARLYPRSLRVSISAFHSRGPCIYVVLFCTVWGFCLFSNITHNTPPYMQFLFVGPNVCRQLPSDSNSLWTPLLLANTSHCIGVFGTFTLECVHMLGAQQKRTLSQGVRFLLHHHLCKTKPTKKTYFNFHSSGMFNLNVKLRPILNTPARPVTKLSAVYLRRLK